MTKDEIRQSLLARRTALKPEEVERLSLAIQTNLLTSPYWPQTGRVGLYAPVKNEVLTQTLFQTALERGLHVYFPRVEKGIDFYEVNGPEDLQRGSWSILEPKIECEQLAEDEALDLLIVPGLAFSRDGYRVGYGKAFYDRYIATHKGLSVALAYEFQLVADIPTEEWDRSLDAIITEKTRIVTRDAS